MFNALVNTGRVYLGSELFKLAVICSQDRKASCCRPVYEIMQQHYWTDHLLFHGHLGSATG